MPNQIKFEIEAGALSAVENAAIAAHAYVGSGDEILADKAAIAAMHSVINAMSIDANIVFGEGDEFESPMLYNGEKIGTGGEEYDIALDAIEGTTLAAKGMQNALSVLAIAPKGGLFKAPEIYMEKIAIGRNYPENIIDLDKSPQENIKNIAQFKGVQPNRIGVCILDRPRHAELISNLREVGARIYLIPDGDVAGVMFTNEPTSDVDIYMGIGGGPEGVLAAAAQKCLNGQFHGRFVIKTNEDKARAKAAGFTDFDRKFTTDELIKGPVVFAACGITNGTVLRGVHLRNGGFETNSLLMNSQSKKARKVSTLRTHTEE